MRKALMAGMLLAGVAAGGAKAASVRDLADAVELHLVKAKAFAAVSCKRDDYAGHEFVLCRPAGAKTPDVLVIVEPGDSPAVYRVNGKAKQLLAGDTVELVAGGSVPLRDWSGEPIDIAAAIEEVTDWF
ncbi:MAG: hypothetical protein KDJ90_06905 [Nitratireductor sp.]|nr:hypothetical protein [Nitratireductor sp.]